ncbi:MAG: hypothetical protein U0231_18555 [Nitrospiraceae bacterium]
MTDSITHNKLTLAVICLMASTLLLIGLRRQAAPNVGGWTERRIPKQPVSDRPGPSRFASTGHGAGLCRRLPIFKAEITAQAKDWESYLVVEQRGQTSTERRLTLDNVTQVTTDKVLENVLVLDTWFDQKKRQYYALAGMNRAQAEASMVERLNELDRPSRRR